MSRPLSAIYGIGVYGQSKYGQINKAANITSEFTVTGLASATLFASSGIVSEFLLEGLIRGSANLSSSITTTFSIDISARSYRSPYDYYLLTRADSVFRTDSGALSSPYSNYLLINPNPPYREAS